MAGEADVPEVGKTYRVRHSRKGTFVLRVTGRSDEWVSGVIVSGKASAMLPYNEVFKGEELTMRTSFCTFTPEASNA